MEKKTAEEISDELHENDSDEIWNKVWVSFNKEELSIILRVFDAFSNIGLESEKSRLFYELKNECKDCVMECKKCNE